MFRYRNNQELDLEAVATKYLKQKILLSSDLATFSIAGLDNSDFHLKMGKIAPVPDAC